MKSLFAGLIVLISLASHAQSNLERELFDCEVGNTPEKRLKGLERMIETEVPSGWFGSKTVLIPRVFLYTYKLTRNGIENVLPVYNNCADGGSFEAAREIGSYYLVDACSTVRPWFKLETSPSFCLNNVCPGQVDFGHVTSDNRTYDVRPVKCTMKVDINKE